MGKWRVPSSAMGIATHPLERRWSSGGFPPLVISRTPPVGHLPDVPWNPRPPVAIPGELEGIPEEVSGWNGSELNSERIHVRFSRNRRWNSGGWHRPGKAESGGFLGVPGTPCFFRAAARGRGGTRRTPGAHQAHTRKPAQNRGSARRSPTGGAPLRVCRGLQLALVPWGAAGVPSPLARRQGNLAGYSSRVGGQPWPRPPAGYSSRVGGNSWPRPPAGYSWRGGAVGHWDRSGEGSGIRGGSSEFRGRPIARLNRIGILRASVEEFLEFARRGAANGTPLDVVSRGTIFGRLGAPSGPPISLRETPL